jgi:hypothetical protein
MISRPVILVCGFVLIALGAMPTMSSANITIGVNIVNPQRLSRVQQDAVLNQLQAAGVHVIRVPLAPPWGGDNYGPAIDFVRHAHERGIKADLIVGLQYAVGAVRRSVVKDQPEMWPSYPLSSADPVRFRAVFQPLLNRLEGLGITFAALELGNEINWAAFNGDFPIPGEERVFDSEDLSRDPEARKIADGYRAYVQTLRVLKDIRDHSRLNRDTPILSAGLSDPGFAGPRPASKADAVTIGATLEYLRANGVDTLVDAYGAHAYPWAQTAGRRLNQLERDTLAECRPPEQGRPCWLTEWGLPGGARPGNDMPQAALIAEMLDDFRQFVQDGRLKGLLYYAWADAEYGIYRCGALTASGRLALDPKIVE